MGRTNNFFASWFAKRPVKRRSVARTFSEMFQPEQLEARQLLSAANEPVFQPAAVQAAAVDQAAPRVLSIVPVTAGTITTPSPSFTVTFNKPVTGVTEDNFVVTPGAGFSPSDRVQLTVTVTPAPGATSAVYTVTVDDASPLKDPAPVLGSLTLDFVDNGKVKAASNQQSLVGNTVFEQPPFPARNTFPGVKTAFTADVNGDGKPDLILQTVGGPMYSLGDGTGGFQTPVAISGPNYITSVGDVNGDGKLDLMSVNSLLFSSNGAPKYFTAFLGSGNGQFVAQSPLTANNFLGSSAIGDFNGDGKADLLLGGAPDKTHRSSTTSYISLGNGNGTFQKPRVVEYNLDLTKEIAVDFNGDGKMDIVGGGANGLAVLLGKGDGTFRVQTDRSLGLMKDLAVGDVNGDGKLDIVFVSAFTSTSSDLTLSVLNGMTQPPNSPFTNVFSQPVSYKAALGLVKANAVEVIDTNGDGIKDVILGSTNGYEAYLLGTPTGLVGTAPGGVALNTGGLKDASVMTVGDFNKDGKVDAVFMGPKGGIVSFVNHWNGDFKGPQKIPVNLRPSNNPQTTTFSGTSIAENKPVGSTVGKFATKSPIKKTTFTYSLVPGMADNAAFKISGTSLVTAQALNFEAKSSYSILVRVVNNRGAAFQKPFTIKVTDVSEPITVPPQTFNVQDLSPPATQVGKVTYTGGSPKQTIKYAITSGNTGNVFAVNQTTGQISVAPGATILATEADRYTLNVSVTATIGKKTTTSNATVTVNVLLNPILPQVLSITTPPITGNTAVFTVTFNENVTGVTRNNFSFGFSNDSVKITNWPYEFSQISDSVYTLTFTGLTKLTSAPGTLGVTFMDPTHTVHDTAGKTIAGNTVFESAKYEVNIPIVNPPQVLSISRPNNDPIMTNSATFSLTLNRGVTGLVPGLFQVVKTGGATADNVVGVEKVSDTVYNITVSGIVAPNGGTVGVKLFDKNATVYDSDFQVLGKNYTATSSDYAVQTPIIGAPAVESIVLANDPPITTESADFIVTFNHDVTGVAAGQFHVDIDGTAIANDTVVVTQLTQSTYQVTVSGIDVETTGGIGLTFDDPDQSVIDGNLLTVGAEFFFESEFYPVKVPNLSGSTVVTLNRGTTDPVTAESTQFAITFSTPVTGLDASNFVVVTTGGVIANPAVVVTQYNDTQWIVTVTGIDFETPGTLGLNFLDPEGQVRDVNNYVLGANDSFTGDTYAVQNGPTDLTPTVLSILKQDPFPIFDNTAEFMVTFNEVVTGVTAQNFVVNTSEGVTADSTVEVTQVGGGMVYLVKLKNIQTTVPDGTLKLDFFGSEGIKDVNNHNLPSGYSYGGVTYPAIL